MLGAKGLGLQAVHFPREPLVSAILAGVCTLHSLCPSVAGPACQPGLWQLWAPITGQHPTASSPGTHHGTLLPPHSEAVGTVLLESTRPVRAPFFTSSPGGSSYWLPMVTSLGPTQLYFLNLCQVPRGCPLLIPPLPNAESQNCSHVLWLSPQPHHEELTSLWNPYR